jgi:hypothetical protein
LETELGSVMSEKKNTSATQMWTAGNSVGLF